MSKWLRFKTGLINLGTGNCITIMEVPTFSQAPEPEKVFQLVVNLTPIAHFHDQNYANKALDKFIDLIGSDNITNIVFEGDIPKSSIFSFPDTNQVPTSPVDFMKLAADLGVSP